MRDEGVFDYSKIDEKQRGRGPGNAGATEG
jgi:hypothetical protein